MAVNVQAEDYSKRERIVNAIAVYPERYEFNAEVISELTDSSEGYVYRIKRDIEGGEVSDSDYDEDLDDELQ